MGEWSQVIYKEGSLYIFPHISHRILLVLFYLFLLMFVLQIRTRIFN